MSTNKNNNIVETLSNISSSATITTTKKKKQQKIVKGKFYSTKLSINKTNSTISVEFPISVLKHLQIEDKNELNWIIIDGVIQLTNKISNVSAIPLFQFSLNKFKRQT